MHRNFIKQIPLQKGASERTNERTRISSNLTRPTHVPLTAIAKSHGKASQVRWVLIRLDDARDPFAPLMQQRSAAQRSARLFKKEKNDDLIIRLYWQQQQQQQQEERVNGPNVK